MYQLQGSVCALDVNLKDNSMPLHLINSKEINIGSYWMRDTLAKTKKRRKKKN